METDDIHALNDYDEFALLHENATEWDLAIDRLPTLTRGVIETGAGEWLSYLRWGTGDPELVFLHGGGQNAHTWDNVALALGRNSIAFDLPGHGHSYRRADRDYGPWNNSDALSGAIPIVAPNATAVIGMSLGGAPRSGWRHSIPTCADAPSSSMSRHRSTTRPAPCRLSSGAPSPCCQDHRLTTRSTTWPTPRSL